MKNSPKKWTVAKIADIVLNPNNPRTIKDERFEKLVQSIRDFPQMLQLRPIVVNSKMMALGGNMRTVAATAAGLDEVPIIIADNLTPEQEREFIIKDNLPYGEWNWEIIKGEWELEKLADWGLEIPEFNHEPNTTDISGNGQQRWIVEIDCDSEAMQECVFNELSERGMKCKVLTL